MVKKTLTTRDAHERPAAHKGDKDSFSDVIKKLTARYSLLDLVGVMTDKEANNLNKHISDINTRMRKEME